MVDRPATAPDVDLETLATEQVRVLSAGIPAGVGISLGAVAVTCWLLAGQLPRALVLAWGAGQVAVQLLRFSVSRALRGREATAPVRWRNRLRGVTLLTGMAWGALPLFLFPASPSHQLFLPLVIGGITGAAIASLGSDRMSVWLFTGAALLPSAGRLMYEGGEAYVVMGALVPLYAVYLAAAAQRSDRAFRDALSTRVWAVEQHKALRRAQEAAHLGSFEWRPQAGYLNWSDEHRRLWDLAPGEVPGYPQFLERVHPDDRAVVDAAFQQAVTVGGDYDWTARLLLPSGRERWVHAAGTVTIDAMGQPARVVGTVQDVTERYQTERTLEEQVAQRTAALREAESKYRVIVESVNEALLVTDLDDVVLDVNPQTLDITGYSREELIGRPAYEVLMDPAEHESMRQRNATRAHGAAGHYELRLRRKDGTAFWALVAGSPLRDADGRVVGTVGAMLDITERKEAERVTLRSQRLEAISSLAGGIAHDLNNALAPVVLGFAELRDRVAPDDGPMLDIYQGSLRRASGMVRHLLAFSRGATGDRVVFRLDHLLGEMERLVRATFPKTIALTVNAPPMLSVRGDATQLHQVLLNL